MPRLDGTGPRGEGPLSGRGEGYCAVSKPVNGEPYGYAGYQGRPVRGRGLFRAFNAFRRLGGRGRGAGRGRGRRGRW
jgi:hypothetical protein